MLPFLGSGFRSPGDLEAIRPDDEDLERAVHLPPGREMRLIPRS